jgi:hypothetical protein
VACHLDHAHRVVVPVSDERDGAARGESAVITVVAFLTPGGEIRASYVTDS